MLCLLMFNGVFLDRGLILSCNACYFYEVSDFAFTGAFMLNVPPQTNGFINQTVKFNGKLPSVATYTIVIDI